MSISTATTGFVAPATWAELLALTHCEIDDLPDEMGATSEDGEDCTPMAPAQFIEWMASLAGYELDANDRRQLLMTFDPNFTVGYIGGMVEDDE